MSSNGNRIATSGCGLAVVTLLAASLLSTPLLAEEVTLEPNKDTTIYQDNDGLLANGAGDYFFGGINGSGGGNRIMRALIAFDLTAIPPGSIIESARLTMRNELPRNDGVQRAATLHRVSKDWGEGSSDAPQGEAGGAQATSGDAT